MSEKILTGAMIRAHLEKKAEREAAKAAPDEVPTSDKSASAAKKG